MPENMEETRLNPRVVDVEIGIHTLRKIKIYPLSVADQIYLADIITKALQKFFLQGGSDQIKNIKDEEFVRFAIAIIVENLEKILILVTNISRPKSIWNKFSKLKSFMHEITNEQMVQIAQIVFETNYSEPVKNAISLSKKIKETLVLERQSVVSAPFTDTGLKTFTESPSEKVD